MCLQFAGTLSPSKDSKRKGNTLQHSTPVKVKLEAELVAISSESLLFSLSFPFDTV
jgi:hypothetical protein